MKRIITLILLTICTYTYAYNEVQGNTLNSTSLNFSLGSGETSSGWVYPNDKEPGISDGISFYTRIAISHGTPYVAYADRFTGDSATVMKFDNNSKEWNNVGESGFSLGAIGDVDIAITESGTPYVVFTEVNKQFKTSVMKFDNSIKKWKYVGESGFSHTGADYTSMAISKTGILYVAYSDANTGVTVMRFNGKNWIDVGKPLFALGRTSNIKIAIDSNNTPYVSYTDWVNHAGVTVMKFTSKSWVVVGKPGFSQDAAFYPSLAINKNGTPYVAYVDRFTGDSATVMKFDNITNTWKYVGLGWGFSEPQTSEISLSLNESGVPYVVFSTNYIVKSGQATVMKLDGNEIDGKWENVGTPNFSQGAAEYIDMAIDESGVPYVSFRDDSNGAKATVMKYLE